MQMRRRSSIGSIPACLAQGEDAIEITKSRHPHYTRNAGPVSRALLKKRTTNQSVAIYAPASDRKDQGPTPDVVADEYAAAHEKKMFHLDMLELYRTSCAPSGLVGLTLCAEKSEQFRLMREHSVDGRDKGDAPEACVRSCFLQVIAAH